MFNPLSFQSKKESRMPRRSETLPPFSGAARNQARRDLFVILGILALAVISVFLFDTGSLAEWIARHKDSKVDELIVVGVVLAFSLGVFSLRRWSELNRQIKKYAELYEELDKVNRESAILGDLADLLQSCLSADEAHKLITDRAQVLFPGSSGAVGIIASSRDLVEVTATWGEPALAERFFAPKDCWALRRGRVHVLDGSSAALTCAHLGGGVHPQQALCVPMMAHGEGLGLLYLDSGRNHAPGAASAPRFPESQQRLAKTLAEHAGLALANLNLREVLRAQSVRDPLTGLFNRRYMEESLDRELRRALRRKSPLGVMMLDVDHFKRFNDSFGHEAGDSVLRSLANVIRSLFRGEDVLCRYGGEEFALILPEASGEAIRQRAEQLRQAVRQTIAEYRGQALDRVTLSIGIASYPEHGATGDSLLRAADSALYRAKEQGRDRVVSA